MYKYIIAFIMLLATASCRKFVELTPPDTSLEAGKVFQSDLSVVGAITAILADMTNTATLYQGTGGVSLMAGLTSDELLTATQQPDFYQLFTNAIPSNHASVVALWAKAYNHIYATNAIIEGAGASTALSEKAKKQAMGEAYFIRGFLYFYLVNLFGDVPLITGTDYKQNVGAHRETAAKVLQQVADDCKNAQSMLLATYADNAMATTTVRFRPNKWAATALLARVYLYQQDWANAEAQASLVIAEKATYILEPNPNTVFKQTSREALWNLPPYASTSTTAAPTLYNQDGIIFSVDYLKLLGVSIQTSGYIGTCYLNNDMVALYEPGDKRRASWVDSLTAGGNKYYQPYKFKNGATSNTSADYYVMLRLAEQYLIRSEARLRQNNLDGARQDLDTLRARAGLAPTTASGDADIMTAVEQERWKELFLEWGHRWFDLKRWPGIANPSISRAEEIMSVVTPKKGGAWDKNWLLFPIPVNEVRNGPNMTQNPGYN